MRRGGGWACGELDGIVEGQSRGKGVRRTLCTVMVMNMKSGEEKRREHGRVHCLTSLLSHTHSQQPQPKEHMYSSDSVTRFCPTPVVFIRIRSNPNPQSLTTCSCATHLPLINFKLTMGVFVQYPNSRRMMVAVPILTFLAGSSTSHRHHDSVIISPQ